MRVRLRSWVWGAATCEFGRWSKGLDLSKWWHAVRMWENPSLTIILLLGVPSLPAFTELFFIHLYYFILCTHLFIYHIHLLVYFIFWILHCDGGYKNTTTVFPAVCKRWPKGYSELSVFSPTKRQSMEEERRIKYPCTLNALCWPPPFNGDIS